MKEPDWTSIDAEWFETMWNQHSQVEDLIKEPKFFEGNLGYSANKLLKGILSSAKKVITIIDPYVDSTLFSLFEIIKEEVI